MTTRRREFSCSECTRECCPLGHLALLCQEDSEERGRSSKGIPCFFWGWTYINPSAPHLSFPRTIHTQGAKLCPSTSATSPTSPANNTKTSAFSRPPHPRLPASPSSWPPFPLVLRLHLPHFSSSMTPRPSTTFPPSFPAQDLRLSRSPWSCKTTTMGEAKELQACFAYTGTLPSSS